MKNSSFIFWLLLFCAPVIAQNVTSNPYSRQGVGEKYANTFAHNQGMGGANIAWRADSTSPTFVNTGNPASYALVRLTTLEVGGRYNMSTFSSSGGANLQKWGVNFAYGSLGFPMGKKGGAAFGIAPYSVVGYETQSREEIDGIGNVLYKYTGTGGLNKFFLGYGVMPFNRSLVNFRTRKLYIPDSLKTLSRGAYLRREFFHELLSDFSIGFNADYMFGRVQNDSKVVYPNIQNYNNTYYERDWTMSDVTGNFGVQTAFTIDSIRDPEKKKKRIDALMAVLSKDREFTPEEALQKRDSISETLGVQRRVLKEKVKFTFGAISTLNNPLNVTFNSASYNYIVSITGQELIRDTAIYNYNNHTTVTLPLEQGIGIGFKKAEKLNIVADAAITDWTTFRYMKTAMDLAKNYRFSIGANFVPNKYGNGRGTYLGTVNYRLGACYQSGYVKMGNGVVSDYYVSCGLGLPVGMGSRRSAMVNVSFQYGQMKAPSPQYVSEQYYRIHFGFTFCDKWFQKFKYD